MNWRPSASLDTLRQRAELLAEIRRFFASRNVLEVEVPALGAATVSDINLESLHVQNRAGHVGYLQTSPEYFMKRLLAAGSGAIYSLAKAYRSDETGAHHRPEFTMLEWYRPGIDERDLAQEVVDLCRQLAGHEILVETHSYGELFERHCGVNPYSALDTELAELARQRLHVTWQDESRSVWLDLLFSHLVEPQLCDHLTVVYDYPACQCALARVTEDNAGNRVARRFEVYWRGIELANGYWELTDSAEQLARFERDNQLRVFQGKPPVILDTQFLAALQHGLPPCSGVALGVDRLVMCILGKEFIRDVMSFGDA